MRQKKLSTSMKKDEVQARAKRNDQIQKVGLVLLASGAAAIVSSIILEASILALVGLGIFYWGILFLFVKPTKYVRAEIMDSWTVSSLRIIDRLLHNLKWEKGVYLPPNYFEDCEGGVFLTNNGVTVDEVANKESFANPKGLLIIPPGLGIVNLIEKKLGKDLSEVDIDFLRNSLFKVLVEELELVQEFHMNIHNHDVHVKIIGSIHSTLCSDLRKHQTKICTCLGCPLCSSIAYALAKVTQKPVVIERNEISSENQTIDTWYRFIEG
jgi:hypothetical protein